MCLDDINPTGDKVHVYHFVQCPGQRDANLGPESHPSAAEDTDDWSDNGDDDGVSTYLTESQEYFILVFYPSAILQYNICFLG